MADYRLVKTKFWDDSYINSLNPQEKLLFLYLLTNSCTDISGAYEISLRKMQFDTSLDTDWIQSVLTRFQTDKKIYYKDGWLYIPNFVKHQITNESIFKAVQKGLTLAPKWIQDLTRLGTVSPQSDIKERKKDSYKGDIKNSRELLKEKWGRK